MKPQNRGTCFAMKVLPLALLGAFAPAQAQTTATSAELDTIYAIEKAASTTKKVNFKAMEESTSTEMKEVLFNEPSINFGGGNGTSQWVTIRGMGQDQIDIKVDDTYTDSQIFHHNGRFLLDPALVKEIEVQKGAGSASAGIGATSGAIVVKTVSAKDLLRPNQTTGFKLNGGVSSNKGHSGGISAYGQFGALDALLVGNWVKEKDYKPGGDYRNADGGDRVLNSGLGQRALLAKFGYELNDANRIELSHRQERTHGRRALREEFDFSQAGDTERNDPRYRVYTQDTTRIEYDGTGFGVVDKIGANVYVMNTKLDSRLSDSGEVEGVNEVDIVGANLNLDTYLANQHILKYGLNARKQETSPASRESFTEPTVIQDTINEEKTDLGAYVEGIWSFQPFTVTTGLRYDHYKMQTSGRTEVSDGDLNPSLAAIYEVNEQLSFNAGIYYATRSPRLYEAMLSGSRVIRADDGLKAERARNIEIGFDYSPARNLLVTGSVFRQNTKNNQDYQCIGVSGEPCGSGNTEAYRRLYNSGTLKNHGYELNASWNTGGWSTGMGVAYSKPKLDGEVADSSTLAIPIGRTWTARLAYQFENPNVELGWRGRFVEDAGYIQSSRGSSGTTETTMVARPGYGVNDIYVNWKPFGTDDLNVNLAINNVFDKYYKSHSQRAGVSTLAEPGRDVRLNLSYRF